MQSSPYRKRMPHADDFETAKVNINRRIPQMVQDAVTEAHPQLYIDYKAVLCMVVMSWIVWAAMTTGTAVEPELIKNYTIVITKMCMARMGGVTSEQLEGAGGGYNDLAGKGAKLVQSVIAVFGNDLPAELPLPSVDERSPWLSPGMWRAAE